MSKPPAEPQEPTIEVKCPVCKEKVRITEAQAQETMKARCSKGHDIELVRAI